MNARTEICPQCGEHVIQPRDSEEYCEECGWPDENREPDPMETQEKALDVQSVEDAKAKVSDINVVGNGDTFALLCKASSKSQGWMKSAKAMEVPGGCVVQVTTQQGSNVAEALTFVPGVKIAPDVNNGRKLVEL
jgi:ribosomal protein L37E